MSVSILPAILAGGAFLTLFYYWNTHKISLRLPPGPKGLPLLGSALELGKVADGAFWLKFAEYADQYGPLVTVKVLNQRHIVVSDPQLAIELFEKRGSNYSDRRISEMTKLTKYDRTIAMLQYGPTLKWYRTLLHQQFSNRASMDYLPIQYHETRKFMTRLLENPKDFMAAARLMSSSVYLRIAYGHEVRSADDLFVKNAALGTAAFAETMQPTRWVVDMLPILRYLPAWFPLATFHRRAKQLYGAESTHRELPFADLEKRMAKGNAEDCFASKLLRKDDETPVDPETREHIKYLTSSVYAGAAGNGTSSLESFFLAMTLYPEAQAKAQDEIDVYMRQHMQDRSSKMILFDDQLNLPYTNALVHEVYRWHPSINMIAHQSRNEDEVHVASQGQTYRIPAGSFVLVNMWKMMHDPEVYEQPDRFMPERYLVENPPPEPENYAFGFGRRICPGVATTKHMLFIAMSNILANFTIRKAKDENGKEITPEERYSSDLTSHPSPFPCDIAPRPGCVELLEEELVFAG